MSILEEVDRRSTSRPDGNVPSPGPPVPPGVGGRHLFVAALFASTIFVSASLLFTMQPMVGKMILPLLGGTPAVWNTCMVFFQAALLAGYLYAHALPARLGLRGQAVVHVALLLLAGLTLPIAVAGEWKPPETANPVPWLLALLTMSVGLPFFMISTTAPLVQSWFARTGHPAARDPYFLYSASNLGSMAALLSYPVLIEPGLLLVEQSRAWAAGYALLIALIAACAAVLWPRSAVLDDEGPEQMAPAANELDGGSARTGDLTATRRLRWVVLALLPSSLMLGVTSYITTDIAAIPLLWIIPLALYLLSFILAFSRVPQILQDELPVWLPALALPLIVVITLGLGTKGLLLMPLHLGAFFLAAVLCHHELAKDRPVIRHLTEFYLWIAVGGVLGGLFNALLAPVIFSAVVEYPLALALVCLFLPDRRRIAHARRGADIGRGWRRDLAFAAGFAVFAFLLLTVVPERLLGLPQPETSVVKAVVAGLVCFAFVRRPLRLGAALVALVVGLTFFGRTLGDELHRERSFFGILTVTRDPAGKYHRLIHGTTLHGQQSLDPARRREPLTYFHPTGPAGQVFHEFSGARAKRSVAVLGLGTGSLASYAEPGQRFTMYEIDPAILRVASDARFFTYLKDTPARVEHVLGDARLRLEEAPDKAYGLIVLDAFSSDAIPVHLLTREAIRLYFRKLDDEGVLIANISNRYLRLEPVVANVAREAGLVGRAQRDRGDLAIGKTPSLWVMLARREADLGSLARDARWQPLSEGSGARVWTDDYSNLFGALRMVRSSGS